MIHHLREEKKSQKTKKELFLFILFTRFVNVAFIVGSSICFRRTLSNLTKGPNVVP